MKFADKPLKTFGNTILEFAIPSQLSFKTALVFRMVRELSASGCVPEAGDPTVELVFDEAITNAMVHGNRLDGSKKVRVALFADQQRWGAIVRDEGEGFGPEDVPKADDLDSLLAESGRGIMLMDSHADELTYNPKGNAVLIAMARRVEAEQPEAAPAVDSSVLAETVAEGSTRTTYQDGVVIVTILEERLSEDNLEMVRGPLDEAADACQAVVVDMHRLIYISSRVIGTLVAVYKHLRARQGLLVLSGMQPTVEDILRSVNLDRLLTIAPDRASAVELAIEHLDKL